MTTSENKEHLASHYALQVALQTMKERCQNLQHRLTSVEDENLRLRMISGIDKPDNNIRSGDLNDKYELNELETLRDKVAELTRQKVQLTEHIAMIATENRQLWSRLSKLTKDNHNLGKIKDNTGISNNSSSSSNCLIRSKTFTQNSPNPALRSKINSADYDDAPDEDFVDHMKISRNHEDFNNTLGFGYLQDQEIDDDAIQNIKRITESLQEYKKEMLWQQNDLKVLLGNLQKHKDLDNRKFLQQQQQNEKLLKTLKNETQILKVDKCLETEPVSIVTEKSPLNRPNLDEQLDLFKQNAENTDKMCPMCGKIFTKQIQFPEFQEHVESHFIDDSEQNDYNSIDRNFEIITHSVGNF